LRSSAPPWQLFFQQSHVIDKRITPRFMRYRRADLWIDILLVIIGAVAMMAVAAATFADRGRAKLNGINPQHSRLLPIADYPRHLANLKLVILDAECAVA
jgi:Mn2+/Fe2+ NRAMP family transporter